jgi:hypothetical protein
MIPARYFGKQIRQMFYFLLAVWLKLNAAWLVPHADLRA